MIIEVRTGDVGTIDIRRYFYDLLSYLQWYTQNKGVSMVRTRGWNIRVLATSRDNNKPLEPQEVLLKQVFDALLERTKSHKELSGLQYRYIIHKGVFVSGIVGLVRLQYDLWGPDVLKAYKLLEEKAWQSIA